MNTRQFTFNIFQENSYIAWADGPGCVAVDPAFCSEAEKQAFFGFLESEGLVPEAILLTHGHFDHVYGVRELQERYGIPVYMDPKEQLNLDWNAEATARFGMAAPDCSFSYVPVTDGQTIEAAGLRFKAISTPGHAPGALCFLEESQKVMFTGDTLFAGTIGRSDLMFGEYDDLIRSIMEKLIILDTDIEILPGHGPSSNIAQERTHNPFLEPFNEPEESFDPDMEGVEIHPFSVS